MSVRARRRPFHLGRDEGARRRPGPRPPASSSRSPTDRRDGPFSLLRPTPPPPHGPAGTRGLAFWGPGKCKSEPTSVKEGVQAFKEFGHDHKFRRHGEALTLLLGPQGWGGGGGAFVFGRGRASSKRKQSSGHPAGLTGCLSSLGEFSCSESEEGERAAVGVFSAWEMCFWCLEESGPQRLRGVRVSPSLGNRSVSR